MLAVKQTLHLVDKCAFDLKSGAKNKSATQGRFNKMKVKNKKKMTPFPSEMLKKIKFTNIPKNLRNLLTKYKIL